MTDDTVARRQEVRALSELGLTELAKASAGLHQTHRAVSDRVFTAVRRGLGPAITPVQSLHNGITDSVYRVVGESTKAAGQVSGKVLDLPLSRPVSSTTRGAMLIGVVNGLIGDELDGLQSPLTEHNISVRVAGRPISVTADELARAFPRATRRIAVYVHGLTETEHAWRVGQRKSAPYEHRLWANGVTSVFIRYNSGRRISTNGQDLAELLDDLVRFWPTAVTDIALLGHSMGGLVLRSATHHGRQADHRWIERVRTTVSLGTPHLGAPLENVAHHASALLTAHPETNAFGRLLRRRSGGIRDLRAGSLLDEDWHGRDPDDLAAALAAEIPLLTGAEHYFVSATFTRDPHHPISRVIGDGLVLHHSAGGRNSTRHIGFAPENGMHVGQANHLSLLNHKEVGDQLVSWIG
ncbi:MAG: alpha/beta hydrolase [Gordonia sp. (in: high G+C Gram-positive bacteria)]|uniref:esterase/lipase family protein n=1 Tax=Gordonia sp. (in: high G+C Gram-positive bacteria) TaxID=84139 RepID=UPI003BB51CD7